MARSSINCSAISRLVGISWRAVAGTVRRVVTERVPEARLSALRAVGVDEFSERKRHRYLTVVVDHDRGEVVWAAKGRGADALAYRQPKRARDALDEWLAWVSRSKLEPFVRLARTIRQHKEGILAYIKDRLTNGFVEGINNRLRTIARRAYVFDRSEP